MRVVKQKIRIPNITLDWTEWISWNKIKINARKADGIKIPEEKGVYEAKYVNSKRRLTIGKAANLRSRVRQGLVKGKIPHSAGKKIRRKEALSKIMIRWAVTNRPAAAEEELHRQYKNKFGKLPKHVKIT